MSRVFRSWSAGMFLFFLASAVLLSAPVVELLRWLAVSGNYRDHFLLAIIVVLLTAYSIPLIALICYSIHHFAKGIRINTNQITCFTLFKHDTVSMESVTAWGTVTFSPRNTKIFLCIATKNSIREFYETHRSDCEKIYGTDRFGQLSRSEEGQWILELTTYLLYKPTDAFFLDYGNRKRVAELTKLMPDPPLFISTLKF